MFNTKPRILFIFVSLLLISIPLLSQNQQDSVSVKTPFRKGRWITGLSGSISSGSNSLKSSNSGINRNQYSIDFRTGKFIKDRLLVGGLISFSRDKSDEFVKRTAETLFAAPMIMWYLADGEKGSLFLNGAGGYVSFRDESSLAQGEDPPVILIDGNGFGILLGFGYSYVLHDRVVFGLGLNYNNSWLSADVTEKPENKKSKENFTVADLSFSFGFSVILDKFFF